MPYAATENWVFPNGKHGLHTDLCRIEGECSVEIEKPAWDFSSDQNLILCGLVDVSKEIQWEDSWWEQIHSHLLPKSPGQDLNEITSYFVRDGVLSIVGIVKDVVAYIESFKSP